MQDPTTNPYPFIPMTEDSTVVVDDFRSGFEPDSIEDVLDSWQVGLRLLHEGDDPDPMVAFPDQEGKVQAVLCSSLEGGRYFTRATDFGVFDQLKGAVAGDWLLWCTELSVRHSSEPPFCIGLAVSRTHELRLWVAARDDGDAPPISPWAELPSEELREGSGFFSSLPLAALRACFATEQPAELTLPAGLEQIEHAWVRYCLHRAIHEGAVPPALLDLIRKTVELSAEEQVGRNQPCPCGSDSKFKKCCGRAA